MPDFERPLPYIPVTDPAPMEPCPTCGQAIVNACPDCAAKKAHVVKALVDLKRRAAEVEWPE